MGDSDSAQPPVPDLQAAQKAEDLAFWNAVQAGDEDARAALVELVASIARARFSSWRVPVPERDDLVAETQLSVLQYVQAGGTVPRSLRGFLASRALGAICRYLREKRAGETTVELEPILVSLSGNAEGPGARLEGRDLRKALWQCEEALPSELRRIFECRYRDGRSQKEIAERMGRSPYWVHRRVHKALRLVRKCLEQNGVLS